MKKTSEKLFFLSYGIYLTFSILNASFYQKYIYSYQKSVMVICVVIAIFSEILKKKLKKKESTLLITCGILFFILLFHMNGLAMFPLFIYIYSARSIDFKKIAKFTAILCSTLLIFIITSAMLGIITNYKRVQVLFGVTRIRYYLGFRYPLFPQMILFNVTLCYFYAYKDNISLFKCIILSILNYWMFMYTDSRLSCYLVIALIFILYFINKRPKILDKQKLICWILVFSFPICSLLSLYTTIKYDNSNPMMSKLNEFLGGRLSLGKNSLSEFKINLFGNDTKYIGSGLDMNGERASGKYNYVDCLYINMLEKYGIIFNVIFLWLLSLVLYNIWKEKDYVLFVILIGFAIHGIVDDLEIYLYYNAFWLVIGSYKRSDNMETSDRNLIDVWGVKT